MTSKSTETETVLADARNRFGFEPNVIQEMATSPVAARLYLKAQDFLAECLLTPQGTSGSSTRHRRSYRRWQNDRL